MNLAVLALRSAWASRTKTLLLSVLVAMGMTVLVVVTELSDASSSGLDDAIAEDVGRTGMYVVAISDPLGLTPAELGSAVAGALGDLVSEPLLMIEELPTIEPECPPYEELGPQPVLVLLDTAGRPVGLPFGAELPVETELCFQGQLIPAEAVYLPTPAEQRAWGSGLFVEQPFADLVLAATTDPVRYSFSVVTGRADDERDVLTAHVTDALSAAALRQGVHVEDVVTIHRADQGDGIRNASAGVKVVYGLIGWGVLGLAALGLLVAEMIVVRERMWFFGLARAVGARAAQIAALVLADIAVVLLVGTGLATAVLAAMQPTADRFAQDAFGLSVQLLEPTTVPQVLGGAVIVLAIAGGYPALRATRQDPVDVLEPKAG